MLELLSIILPVFIIFGIGFIAQKKIGFHISSISTMCLYILAPSLAFTSFYKNEMTIDYVYILAAMLLLTIALVIVSFIVSKMMRTSKSERSAMMLSTVFMNAGNYGAPVILFAYGQTGFDYAVIVLVINSLLMNTLGVFFAALGSSQPTDTKTALRNVAKMPVLYAVFFAITLNVANVPLPDFLLNALSLLAQGSVPVLMLVLGMQLAQISLKRVQYRLLTASTIIRMVISPFLAWAVISLFPVSDLITSLFIIQMSMPTAVVTTLFALKYDTEPDLVSFTTFVTTVISMLTIPIVLHFVPF